MTSRQAAANKILLTNPSATALEGVTPKSRNTMIWSKHQIHHHIEKTVKKIIFTFRPGEILSANKYAVYMIELMQALL